MNKIKVQIKHMQTYMVYVDADTDEAIRNKAIKTVCKNGSFDKKYLVDDEVSVERAEGQARCKQG